MNKLEVIRAGAGSGKTTELCRIVAEAVSMKLDPSRILATTFTKKAAAELKSRMQAKLLGLDGDSSKTQFGHADRFDLAAIGTVHSVAIRLLSRYAIEMGLSPALEVLDESGSGRTLNDLLGQVQEENWVRLSDAAMRLSEDDLQKRILKLLEIKRGNRISDELFLAQMSASTSRLCEILGTVSTTLSDNAGERLLELAEQAMEGIALLNDTTGVTEGAKDKLRRLLSQGKPSWGKFVEAQKIEAGKRTGANAKLDPLRAFAAQVRNNPCLHEDIRHFGSILAEETLRLNHQYQTFKKERGYVDYIDLEILFLELLSNDNVREQIQHDYDLVLVDEFQDTNPLQLAIFQSLRSLTKRTCWVGDPKQAIYSFRDTDPELVNRVWSRKGNTDCRELSENYRSQEGLVQFVGRAFEASLGAEAKQNPKKPSAPRGLERWLLETKNNADEATALAVGIAKLREEGTRLGDIAVLEKTNSALADLAIALDQVGIPYLLESPGLFSTREGALVLSGLRLAADRNDSLAAATILHLKSDPDVATPKWLEERLREIRARDDAKELLRTTENAPPVEWQSPWHGDPTLAKLEALNREILPPSVIVQQVIEALAIPAGIRNWADPVRRFAHLDSILKHACNYEDTTLHAGEAATLTGLILYFEELSGSNTDNRHPPLGHDAVTLMTYHGAKGLEWPTVILSGLDSERDPDVWLPIAHGGSHSDTNPLEGRSLRYWIWPFGTDNSQFKRRIRGSGLEDDALASQEGAAAREKSIEESIRLLYVGCTRAKQKLVFAHRPAKYDWLKQIADIDILLDPSLEEGEHELLGMGTTLVIRRLNAEADEHIAIAHDAANWFATQERVQRVFAKRFHSPSSVKSNEQANVRVEELIGPSLFPSGAKEEHYSAIGDATHTYLGAMPSMLSLTDAQKHVVAERSIAGFGITGKITPQMLVAAGDRFSHWAIETFPGAKWLTELSVSGPRAAGGNWRGAVDLVLVLADGSLVVIDHKSAPIRRVHCEAKAQSYSGQLQAYKDVLTGQGETVSATFIHFPFAGTVIELMG